MRKENCKYCKDVDYENEPQQCKEMSPKMFYFCSRKEEHGGQHVACGIVGHQYKIWENSKKGENNGQNKKVLL